VALAIILLAMSFVIVGGLLCLWAGYVYLAPFLGQPLSALIMGVGAIVVAGLCLWVAKKLTG